MPVVQGSLAKIKINRNGNSQYFAKNLQRKFSSLILSNIVEYVHDNGVLARGPLVLPK